MLTMTTTTRGGRSAGFTMVELLVGLLVIGLIAGAMVPQVMSRLRQGESATLAQNLSALTAASYAFQKDVGRFPGRLEYLAMQPAAAVSSCQAGIANLTGWKGPYLARQIPATGLVSGPYVISNTPRRVPATIAGTVSGLLYFDVPGVDREVADALEAAFDGNGDLAGGTITWAAATGTLSYAMPVRGC
jgi:prepilin-type N-terminal cleavage/methylation domain-containing protein